MKNLLIENPDHQGKVRRLVQRTMTLTLWLLWLYLLLPIFEPVLAGVETAFNPEIFMGVLLLFSVMMLSFWLWARYNILLYRFRDERQIEYKPLACNELAEAFGISPLALTDWHNSKQLLIRLTEQGGIYSVEGGSVFQGKSVCDFTESRPSISLEVST